MLLLFPSPAPKMRKVKVREKELSTQSKRYVWRVSGSPDSSHSAVLLFYPWSGVWLPGQALHAPPSGIWAREASSSYRKSCLLKGHHKQPLEHPRTKKINTGQHLVVRREAKTIEKPGWHPAVLDRGCFARPTADLLLYFIFSNTEHSSSCPWDTWLGRQIINNQLMWRKINF